uniref:Uncharacterized protein n=1 Tax=Fundulus heteroclitus TaxID=8078 RepID=A0A3Q2UKE3_FUNHE
MTSLRATFSLRILCEYGRRFPFPPCRVLCCATLCLLCSLALIILCQPVSFVIVFIKSCFPSHHAAPEPLLALRSGKEFFKGDKGRGGRPGNAGATGMKGALKCNCGGESAPRGLPGPAGLQGDAGMPGEFGYDGDMGDPGPKGADGLPGSAGFNGLQGPKGRKGDTGLAGEKGYPGDIGEPGNDGPVGTPGAPGPNGLHGFPGSRGLPVSPSVLFVTVCGHLRATVAKPLNSDCGHYENSTFLFFIACLLVWLILPGVPWMARLCRSQRTAWSTWR